ncbi:MAG: hypothetical protein PHR38_02315 [Bacteroidales bacterium]|nr:hypothetical protein [Bacteroidales bacterium]MDD3907048.1 hypothetical protein [Bacteroidales bacterium]MDD4712174.1 hypothetical protein [Bacteroidales bacterium]
MKKGFLTKIAYSNGLWIAGLLLLLFSVFGNMFYSFTDSRIVEIPAFAELYGSEIFGFPLDLLLRNQLFGHILRFLLLLGSALLLQYISSEFRLIRVRSFFPFFLFCVFSATIIPAVPFDGSSIACFLFCWSCSRLFYALDGSVNHVVFDASALLTMASLFQSKIIYILVVFWLVMGILQVFSFKSFCASIFGMMSIYWIIGGVSFLMDDYHFIMTYSQSLISFEFVDFNSFSPAEIAYTSFLGLLMISAMVSFWPRQNLDKLRTRNYLNSVLLLWFSLLALWLFSGNGFGILLLLFSLSSLMAAHFFSLIDIRFSRALFILFIVLSISVRYMLLD